MPERRYVAADSPEEIEMERLNALEEIRDGIPQRRLESLGIRGVAMSWGRGRQRD